jgi:4-hydroxy-tetrahydrodipicolinate synthase
VEIAVPTVVRLAESCPNIRCLKEAGGSVERINQLRAALPEEFTLLSGDDSLTLPFLSAGARGVISVASNLVPSVMSELVASWLSGDVARAGELHQQYYPLFRDLFVESNPVPIKHALARAGIISSPEVRLPLAPLSEPAMAQLTATLQSLSLSA